MTLLKNIAIDFPLSRRKDNRGPGLKGQQKSLKSKQNEIFQSLRTRKQWNVLEMRDSRTCFFSPRYYFQSTRI